MRIIDSDCLFGRWPKKGLDISVERLLGEMAALGIEKGLAVSLRGVFYCHEEGNAETMEVCGAHPRLVPVATIRPSAYGESAGLPGRLAEGGFRMLRLFPEIQGWAADDIIAERIYAECAEAGMPVVLAVGKRAGVATALVRTAPPGCRLILGNVYYNVLAECAEALRRREEFMLEVGRTAKPYSLEFLCEHVGAGRLLLGTRQPLECGRGPIEMIRNADLSDEDKARMLGGNVESLLGGI